MTRRIAIVHYNGIGDHVLTRPAIAATVAAGFGDCDFVGLPGAAELFYRDIAFRAIVPIAMEWREMGEERFDVAAVAQRIRGCDLLVSLNRSPSRAIAELCRLARPARTAGFFAGYDVVEPFSHAVHAADLAFSLVRRLGTPGSIADFRRPLDLPPEANTFARGLRAQLGPRRRLVVLHNETVPEKQWPRARLRRLALGLLEHFSDAVILTVGRTEALAGTRHHRLLSAHGVGLAYSLALAQEADLFVGIDSCFLHAADAADVPAVGLFGPTDPAEWGPCGAASCAIKARTMAGLALEAVWPAVTERLEASKREPALTVPRAATPAAHPDPHRRSGSR